MENIRLIGFNITKIKAEKNPAFSGKLEIKSNINIKNIERFKPDLAKQEAIKVEFNFDIDYSDLGSVSLEGVMFVLTDSKSIKQIINSWKDKKLDKEFQIPIINLVVQKASLKAFQIEEELGLPIHIQLPRLQKQEKSQDDE